MSAKASRTERNAKLVVCEEINDIEHLPVLALRVI
jgi:hypothetical protein